MANPKSRRPEPSKPGISNTPSLNDVLGSIENFLDEVITGVLSASPAGETVVLATATGDSLRSQLRKLHGYVRDNHKKLSSAQVQEFQVFLDTQDGHGLAQRGADVARVGFKSGGFGSKFLKWLVKWFQEIKKIIEELLNLVADALGFTLPDWIHKLLLILDQVFNALISLLADVFGIDLGRFSSEVSRMEQDYLMERAAFERLRQERARGRARDDE